MSIYLYLCLYIYIYLPAKESALFRAASCDLKAFAASTRSACALPTISAKTSPILSLNSSRVEGIRLGLIT